MTNIKQAIEAIKQASDMIDAQTRFWYHDEIPSRAKIGIDQKTHIRANRICFYMNKHKLPVYRPWLEQLLRWHRVKGGSIKTPVLALKYQLLYEAMKHGMEWTERLDSHAEALAMEAYQEHKEKTRRE